jgi:L-threonylcarbamoyladenylate synthase
MVVKEDDPQLFSIVIRTLKKGDIIIISCDTIYGIVGIAPETGEKIAAIKGRNRDKPFIQLIPDHSWVKKYSDIILPVSLRHLWPGPLTLILQLRSSGTAGLRVPDEPFLRRIMKHLGKPLFSTSVNRQGEKPLHNIDRIIDEFKEDVALIVDSGNVKKGIPSTILDITEKPYRIVRQGVLEIPPDVPGYE